jgi:uncharacterized membrane protein
MKEFLAHLHPVLVHLPIGILLLAAIFAWMGRRERHAPLLAALPMLLRLGAVAAVAACGSGWLLGGSGEYDPDTLGLHKWLGIFTAFLAALACFVPKPRLMTTLTAISLTIAAHFGGTLTHGAGYLFPSTFEDSLQRPSIADIQETAVFSAVVQTILKEKCSSCHGSTKQKGGLRLDMVEHIRKGGKNGDVFKSVGPEGGELLRRCLLPIGHEDHMPPREKPQLSSDELEILRWWIAEGADFERKTKDFPQPDMVRRALANWQKGGQMEASPAIPDIPEASVQAASPQLLEQLRQAGVLVLPVSRESNWLSVSFVNLPRPADSVLVLLEKIVPQVLWLNMNDCTVSETAWKSIGELQQLRRLSLNHSSVTDASLLHLKNMHQLQVLNISDTKVTAEGLGALANLKALHTIFLYKTGIQAQEWTTSKALFPQTKLDSGGYQLPFLETDTLRKKMEKTY